MRVRSLSLSLVLFAAACGGGGGNPDAAPHVDSRPTIDAPATPDAPQTPDAPVIADAATVDATPIIADAAVVDAATGPDATLVDAVTTDANPACLASSSYGTPTLANQVAQGDPAGFMDVAGELNADIDTFDLTLFAGYGVFAAGTITTGTFDIVGDETNYATCGVCPFIFADNTNFTNDLFDTTHVYQAVSGQVTITSLSPNLTGHLDNLVLQHVTIDSSTIETTVVGDCSTTITSADFDSPVPPPALVGGMIRVNLHKPIRHH